MPKANYSKEIRQKVPFATFTNCELLAEAKHILSKLPKSIKDAQVPSANGATNLPMGQARQYRAQETKPANDRSCFWTSCNSMASQS